MYYQFLERCLSFFRCSMVCVRFTSLLSGCWGSKSSCFPSRYSSDPSFGQFLGFQGSTQSLAWDPSWVDGGHSIYMLWRPHCLTSVSPWDVNGGCKFRDRPICTGSLLQNLILVLIEIDLYCFINYIFIYTISPTQ